MKISKMCILLAVCCILLTGCWDKMEIDDRNYVISMGIDKYEEQDKSQKIDSKSNDENKYTISLGMAELEKSSGGQNNENEEKGVKLLSGSTLAGTMKLSDLFSSRQTYFGQTKVIVFGERLLEDSKLFREALDVLERNQDINMKIIVLAAKGKASDVINSVSGANDPTGLFIWDFYKNNSKEVAATTKLDFETLLISLRRNSNAMIPLADTKDKTLLLGGSALIKNYQLCGYLDENEERGSLWIEGDAEGAVLEAIYENINIPMRVIKNSSDISFIERNQNIICNIDISVKGNVEGFIVDDVGIFNDKTIEEIEDVFEEMVKKEVINVIEQLQKRYDVDSLDFVGELNKRSYDIYKNHIGNPEAIFRGMDFNVSVNVDISGIGMIN